MNVMTEFSHRLYESLNPSTSFALVDGARHHLARLGSIICDHGLSNHFGVVFLHKHFDIAPGEMPIETLETKQAVIEVSRDRSHNVVPYIWRVADYDISSPAWYPTEFVKATDRAAGAADQAEIFMREHAFRLDVGRYLIDHGIEGLFGIMSRHREVLLGCHATGHLVETSDRTKRRLTIAVEPFREDATDQIETVWTFDRTDGIHVRIHCKNTCQGSGAHH